MVLVCMGLVLGGGALSLAELATESVGEGLASGAVQGDGEGGGANGEGPDGQPARTGDGGVGSTGADPPAGARTASASASESGSPSAKASKSPSAKATDADSPSASDTATSTGAATVLDAETGGAPSETGSGASSAPRRRIAGPAAGVVRGPGPRYRPRPSADTGTHADRDLRPVPVVVRLIRPDGG